MGFTSLKSKKKIICSSSAKKKDTCRISKSKILKMEVTVDLFFTNFRLATMYTSNVNLKLKKIIIILFFLMGSSYIPTRPFLPKLLTL